MGVQRFSWSEQYILYGIAGVTMAVFAITYITQPLVPFLASTFRARPSEAGWTVSATVLALAIASPLWGRLSDRIGRRPTMRIGASLLVVPTLLMALATSLGVLIVLRALQGVCIAAVTAVMLAYIGEIFPIAKVGRAMGVYVASTLLGGLWGRMQAAVLTDMFGWRVAMASFVLVALLAYWGVEKTLPTSPKPATPMQLKGRPLKHPALRAAYVLGGCILFCFIGIFTYVSYPLQHLGLSTSQIGLVYICYLSGVLGAPMAGILADRIGRTATVALGLTVAVVGVLCTLIYSVSAILLGLLLVVLGIFTVQPAMTSTVGELAHSLGEPRGVALSGYQASYYLGGCLAGVLVGWAWEYGAWPACVAACVLVLLLGVWAVLQLRHQQLAVVAK